jgi:hypothetical protein
LDAGGDAERLPQGPPYLGQVGLSEGGNENEPSLGALALLALVQLDRRRGRMQRLLDAATGGLALWSAVASVVYTGTTLTWLSFGEGLGFVGIALIGLIAHELKTERVVHAFESIPAEAHNGDRAEELQAAA